MSRNDIERLKDMLVQRLDGLIGWLGIHVESSKGINYMCLSPFRPEKNASMWIKKSSGAWRDMGGAGGSFKEGGDAGDVLQLIAAVRCSRDNSRAIREAYDFLNMRPGDRTALAKGGLSDEEIAARKKSEAQKQLDQESKARAYWQRQHPSLFGTLAEDYLNERGVDLRAIVHLEPTLRFDPAAPYWRARDAHGHCPRYPAIIAQMQLMDGRHVANHYTFIDRNGRKKAPVEKAKLMWPSVHGAVIRLTRGASGLPLADALIDNIPDDYGYAEGIEDGLTIAQAEPDLRMWAAGSLSQYLNCPLPPNARSYLICRDNDWGKAQARASFNRAHERFLRTGAGVAIFASPTGKDANDIANTRPVRRGEDQP